MTWQSIFKIVEIRTKIVSLSTFILALLSVLWMTGQVPAVLTILLLIAVLAVDMGTTAFNTFFDYENGVDLEETNKEDDKVLVHQGMPPGYALVTALTLFSFAAVLGLFLALLTGWPVLVLGAVSLLVAFLYSGGRTPISSTPWGELFAGFFLGTILWIVVFYVLASPAGWKPDYWWRVPLFSLPSLLFIASILTVNNCCDRIGDQQAGRRTLALVWGPAADVLILVLPLGAYCLQAVFAITGVFPIWFLYSALAGPAFSLLLWRGMFRRGFSHETKGINMKAVSAAFMIFTLLSIFTWSLGILIHR